MTAQRSAAEARQIQTCHPWVQAEILVVKPRVIVCLGATAAQALISKEFRISKQRGELLAGPPAEWIIASHHPSAILRAPDRNDRTRKREELIGDLETAAKQLAIQRKKNEELHLLLLPNYEVVDHFKFESPLVLSSPSFTTR